MNKPSLKTVPGGQVVMIDGLDGVGKTTQIERISKQLSGDGWLVKKTRVIGGTQIGEALRPIMLSATRRSAETDLYIAMAMYSQLAIQLADWRQENAIILVDRSPLCTVAYQAYGEKAAIDLVEDCLDKALKKLKPNLIVVYDLDVDEALARDKNKLENYDYFTSHDKQFFNDVRSGYLEAVKKHTDIARLIDISNLTIEQISLRTLELVDLVAKNPSS